MKWLHVHEQAPQDKMRTNNGNVITLDVVRNPRTGIGSTPIQQHVVTHTTTRQACRYEE